MPKPTPGSTYTVVKDDTLWDIAKAAFGNPWRFQDIFDANKSTLRSGDPWWIYPGEILIIPPGPDLGLTAETVEEDSELLPDADPEKVQLLISGQEVPCESFRLFRAIDKGSARWTATVYWDPEILDLSILFEPYKWQEAKAYVGGHLMDTGYLYIVEASSTPGRVELRLTGFSRTKDLVDSTVDPPYQINGMTLSQIANEYCSPRSIQVIDDTPGLGVFPKSKADKSETIFNHLAKLAKQKGVLINSTPKGHLRITKAPTQVDNHGTIGDGFAFGSNFQVTFDGTKRFRNYRVLGKRRGKRLTRDLVIDQVVPKSRSKTIVVDDVSNNAELRKVGEWERSKALADSLRLAIEVSDWYGPDGRIWRESNHVTVKSPRLFISKGFTFLIQSVEYILDSSGRKTALKLVPPTAFTGEELEEPWI